MNVSESINRDSYMNIKGTTCKSFKIGKTSISFASKAILKNDDIAIQDNVDETISKYKRLVSTTNEKGEKVIYDSDIPLTAVKHVEERDGKYTFVVLSW